jgi:WD40 repeat protein
MAGFEYRDKDAKVTYGTISSPLTIKDSGNKCCDEVTVIYDYYDEESKKAERIRIRYWAEPHTSNKGSRHRLYKQKDILGQNKKILAKPKLGTKDVMADYIEDLQIINIVSNAKIYIIGHSGFHPGRIRIYDPATNKEIKPSISTSMSSNPDTAFGPDGLLYILDDHNPLMTYNPVTKKKNIVMSVDIRFTSNYAIAFGPDGLLYVTGHSNGVLKVYDLATKKEIKPPISTGGRGSNPDIAFGPDGLLYILDDSRPLMTYNPVTKKKKNLIDLKTGNRPNMAIKSKRTGQESLVTINLTLRTKNQYGKDRQFKKKDYHSGNYKLDKTDKYKRDTFSSTVLVRNLAL